MATLYMADWAIEQSLDLYSGAGGAADLDGCYACLFNLPSTAVSHSTLLGAITESSFPGYARIHLNTAWPASVVTAHVAATTWGATLTWTCTGGSGAQVVYGVYLLNGAGTKLLAIANFDSGPYTIVNNGDAISETLTVTMQSEA